MPFIQARVRGHVGGSGACGGLLSLLRLRRQGWNSPIRRVHNQCRAPIRPARTLPSLLCNSWGPPVHAFTCSIACTARRGLAHPRSSAFFQHPESTDVYGAETQPIITLYLKGIDESKGRHASQVQRFATTMTYSPSCRRP